MTTVTGRPPEDRRARQRSGSRRASGRAPPTPTSPSASGRSANARRAARAVGRRGRAGRSAAFVGSAPRAIHAARAAPEAVGELLPGGRSRVLVVAGAPVLLPEVRAPLLLARRQVRFVRVEVHLVGIDAHAQLVPVPRQVGEAGLQPHRQQRPAARSAGQRTSSGRGRVARWAGGSAVAVLNGARVGMVRRARRVGRRGIAMRTGGGAAMPAMCAALRPQVSPPAVSIAGAGAGRRATAARAGADAGVQPEARLGRRAPGSRRTSPDRAGADRLSASSVEAEEAARPAAATPRNAGSSSSAGSALGTRSARRAPHAPRRSIAFG